MVETRPGSRTELSGQAAGGGSPGKPPAATADERPRPADQPLNPVRGVSGVTAVRPTPVHTYTIPRAGLSAYWRSCPGNGAGAAAPRAGRTCPAARMLAVPW